MNKAKSLLLVMTALIMASCGVKEQKMNYDSGLLEDAITNPELQISYQVPKGYIQYIDENMIEASADSMNMDKPITVFVDSMSKNNIILYDLRAVPQEFLENNLDFYFSTFNPKDEWDRVKKRIFKFGEFPKIVELTMYNEMQDQCLQKYYFYEKTNDNSELKSNFAVTYFFRLSEYDKFNPFKESSLASFKKNYEIIIDVDDSMIY